MITPTPAQIARNRFNAEVRILERDIRQGTKHRQALSDLREAKAAGYGEPALAVIRFRVALYAAGASHWGDALMAASPKYLTYDATRPCPKCKHDDVSTVYRTGREYNCRVHRSSAFNLDAVPADEHFDRTCQRCHFGWREEVG